MNYFSQSFRANWQMCFFILLFIFSPILSTQDSAQPGALYVVLMVLPTIIIALNNGFIKINNLTYYAYLLFAFALFSTLISEYGHFRPEAIIKFLLFILFFICTSSFVFPPKQLKFALKSYLFLSLAISILIILSYIFGYVSTESEYYKGRYSIGITGLDKNVNYLTSFYNIAFFVICYIFATIKLKKKTQLMFILMIPLFLYSSYLSGTRAAVLLELIIITLSIAIVASKKHFYTAVFLVLFVASIIVIFYEQISEGISFFLGERELLEDVSRSTSWDLALKYIKDSPIFGCGHEAWYFIPKSSLCLHQLHNIFLELFWIRES